MRNCQRPKYRLSCRWSLNKRWAMQFLSRRTFWVSAATWILVLVVGAWFLMPRSKLNQANFDKISDGMTEEEVTAILGEPERKVEGVMIRIEGAVTLAVWSNGLDRIGIVFRKGKVLEKHVELATAWEKLKWHIGNISDKCRH